MGILRIKKNRLMYFGKFLNEQESQNENKNSYYLHHKRSKVKRTSHVIFNCLGIYKDKCLLNVFLRGCASTFLNSTLK